MYKQILLAYDGSLEGALALREGALLARRAGAKVFLLCVVPAANGVELAEGVYQGAVAKQIESYRTLLERAVERLRELGFAPAARLLVGEPTPIIGAVAKEIAADLVVVGHKEQSFLSRWWSGSTQATLSEQLTCSLLIARQTLSDEEFEAQVQQAT